ncbi:MAG: hypothetical protein AAFV69_12320, partial [Pseudomonadota bacterium]
RNSIAVDGPVILTYRFIHHLGVMDLASRYSGCVPKAAWPIHPDRTADTTVASRKYAASPPSHIVFDCC